MPALHNRSMIMLPFMMNLAMAHFIHCTPFLASVRHALPVQDPEFGAETELRLIQKDGTHVEVFPHFPEYFPLGIRGHGPNHSCHLQCQRCFSCNSFGLEQENGTWYWQCRGMLHKGTVQLLFYLGKLPLTDHLCPCPESARSQCWTGLILITSLSVVHFC